MTAKRLPKAPVPKGLIWWKELPRHPLNIALGREVFVQRTRRGWSLDDVHDATGISKSHLWDLEQGRHGISLDMMLALETVFGMAPNGLLVLGRRRMELIPGSRTMICSV